MCIFSKPSAPPPIQKTDAEKKAEEERKIAADKRQADLDASNKRLEAANEKTRLANEKRAAELDAQTAAQQEREQQLIRRDKKRRLETKVADTRSKRGRRSLITGSKGGRGFIDDTSGGNFLAS